MSKLHPKLEPFVITSTKNHFSDIEEMKTQRDKLEEVIKSLSEEDLFDIPNNYTYTARSYVFPILKSQTVDFHRGPEDIVKIPRFLVTKPKLLKEAYDGVVIDGRIYNKNHESVVKAKDTENYILKEKGYKILTGGFCEKRGNLVKLPHLEGYANKKDVVVTHDTKRQDLKQNCYKWEDGSKVRYYKYRKLAPDHPEQRIYFNEATFPEPEEIKETRVGIELEYSSAIMATRKALPLAKYRNVWNSVRDGSIPREGTEFVSIPLKKEELTKVEEFMNFVKHKAKINESCGFHVHVGSPDLDFVSLTSVVLLCQNVEEDLFKLVDDYRQNNRYCKRLDKSFRGFEKVESNDDEKEVADIFYEDAGTSYEKRHKQSKHSCNDKRHYWISIDRFFRFRNEPHKRTVEFRMFHATKDTDEFMKFVLLCYYLVQFCIENTMKVARNSSLQDVIDWIPNRIDRRKVEDFLYEKKVIEYV